MMKRRKKMKEAVVTVKFTESEINMLYESLSDKIYNVDITRMAEENRKNIPQLGKEFHTLKKDLKDIKRWISDEKEKVKQEHKEG